MKKIFTTALIILWASSLFSQGIYIKAGGGYGLPIATSQIGTKYLHAEDYSNSASINNYSENVVSASYGAGANFNLGLGYELNKNLLFEMNVQYIAGQKFKTSDIHTYNSDGYSYVDRDVFTSHSGGFYFNPSIVFSAGFGKGAPYGRFGIIAASPKITKDESYYSDSDGTITRDITWVYSKGLALGYQTAVGMNWKLAGDRLNLYTEAGFISLTYYAREGNMTKSLYDGNNNLDQLTLWQKQTLYRKKFDPGIPYNPDIAQTAPREASPFSSLSVQAGIRFMIWHESE